jgi:hypothetical protein
LWLFGAQDLQKVLGGYYPPLPATDVEMMDGAEQGADKEDGRAWDGLRQLDAQS